MTSSVAEPYPKPEGPFGLIIANSDMAISSCNAPTHRPRRCLVLRMDGENKRHSAALSPDLARLEPTGLAGPDRGQVWPPISFEAVSNGCPKPRRA